MSPDGGVGGPGTVGLAIAKHVDGVDGAVGACQVGEDAFPGVCAAQDVVE